MKTYVTNTRTFALTEYENYPFNSFAAFNGKYYAAGPDGLFEIDIGTLDDTADIVGRFSTGKHDFGSAQQKRLADLFLSGRLEGDLTVSVTPDEGETYPYVLKNYDRASLVQHRVNIGRGIKARYLQIEVEGDVDFDIADMNLNVMELSRRL